MAGVDLPNGHGGDDVLAQPTRRRLFGLLADVGGAASTDELAARLGLHPNGVRTHLQRMRDAGLLVHRRVGGPRGRPRDEWAVSPTARPAGEDPHGYNVLARWLARTIPATPERLHEVEATGREIGRELATGAGAPPGQAVLDVFAALGFHPHELAAPAGALSCRLDNCPYRDAVRENQDVVCTLHRGLTGGLLEVLAPDATLTRFVPHDPDRAGCEVDALIPGPPGAAGSPPAART
jgi:predicted ArsR family transcriptional regulator